MVGHTILPTTWFDTNQQHPVPIEDMNEYELAQSHARAQHAAYLAQQRELRRARRAEQEGVTIIQWLTIIELPPLSADPLPFLVTHEYTSLFVFLIRTFLFRPIWHLMLWWHIICGMICCYILIRHRHLSSSSPSHSSSSSFTFLLHLCFWFFHGLIFGWPVIYLLRQQINETAEEEKPKAT